MTHVVRAMTTKIKQEEVDRLKLLVPKVIFALSFKISTALSRIPGPAFAYLTTSGTAFESPRLPQGVSRGHDCLVL